MIAGVDYHRGQDATGSEVWSASFIQGPISLNADSLEEAREACKVTLAELHGQSVASETFVKFSHPSVYPAAQETFRVG